MVSILDGMKNLAAGQLTRETAGDPVLGHLADLINNPETGGLTGFIERFRTHGLGELVNTWLGNGPNQPITAGQISRVIGQERLNEAAARLGMEPERLTGLIAQHLPNVIDQLTPGGAPPRPAGAAGAVPPSASV